VSTRGTYVCIVYKQHVYKAMVRFTLSAVMSYLRSHATLSSVLLIQAISKEEMQVMSAEATRCSELQGTMYSINIDVEK
jgi:hypothetical protein